MGGADNSRITGNTDGIPKIVARSAIGRQQFGLLNPVPPFAPEEVGCAQLSIFTVCPYQDSGAINGYAPAKVVVCHAIVSGQNSVMLLVTPSPCWLAVKIDGAFVTVFSESTDCDGLAVEIQHRTKKVAAIKICNVKFGLLAPGSAAPLINEYLSRCCRAILPRGSNNQRIPGQGNRATKPPISVTRRSGKFQRFGHSPRPAIRRFYINVDGTRIRSLLVVIQSGPQCDGIPAHSNRNAQKVTCFTIGSRQLGNLLPTRS